MTDTSISLAEATRLREETERQIEELLCLYQSKTGLGVTAISLETSGHQLLDQKHPFQRVVSVSIESRL